MVVRRIRPARRVFHTRPCVGKAVLTIQIDAIKQAPWFTAPWFPFAVLHRDLRIVAINPAFEVATHQPRAALVGRSALKAFPENPADPQASSAAPLQRAMETVLRTAERHWVGCHRYDVPHPDRPGHFLFKVWMAVDVPVLARDRVVGVLHHVQDVTEVVRTTGTTILTEEHTAALDRASDELHEQFPDVAPLQVLGLLTDSLRVVLHAALRPDIEATTTLTRLRLEVATRRPAADLPTGAPIRATLTRKAYRRDDPTRERSTGVRGCS